MEGKYQHATFEQMFIDFLRKEYGDSRNASWVSRANVSEYDEGCTISIEHDHGGIFDDDERYRFDRSLLSTREQIIIECLEQDFKQAEIADLLGVSPARICFQCRQIEKKIASFELYLRYKIAMESQENFGVFEIAWIKLD